MYLEENILKLNELKEFVKLNTSNYDESHDYQHALNVFENCKKIIELEQIENVDWNIIAYAALLHDVCDHKYESMITKHDLHDFIDKQLQDSFKTEIIMKIINNISYTCEVNGKLEKFNEPYQTYRNIISDADKLEALGEVGLKRCQQYSKFNENNVVKHCHEKLLRLLPNGFIKTNSGRKLALDGHNYILNYCNSFSS